MMRYQMSSYDYRRFEGELLLEADEKMRGDRVPLERSESGTPLGTYLGYARRQRRK